MSLKRTIFVGLAVLVAFGGSLRAETVEKLAKPTTYVSDFAGVIDEGSKQSLEDLSRQVYEKAHATIVVVTIHSLEGQSIEDFSTALEDKWQVGAKGTDKGLLMVFAIDDHKRRIEVGRGLEGILNDAKVGDIGRDMVPQLKQGAYGPAMLLGVQELSKVIAADAGVTLDAPQPVHTYHRERTTSSGGGGFHWFGFALIALFILLISRGGRGGGSGGLLWFLLGSMMNGRGRSWGRGSGGWDGGGGGGDSGGSGGGGGDFGGGFGGGSDGGGSSGDW